MSLRQETILEETTRFIRDTFLLVGLGQIAIGSEISTPIMANGLANVAIAGLIGVARRSLITRTENMPTSGSE